MIQRLRSFGRDSLGLAIALRDQRAPLQAKIMSVVALVYALSPWDILPDITPLVGLADDVLLVPTLLTLAYRTLPTEVKNSAQQGADKLVRRLPWLVPVALVVLLLLVVALLWSVWGLWQLATNS